MKKKSVAAGALSLVLFSVAGLSSCGLAGGPVIESCGVATTSVAVCEILDALDYDDVVGIPETDSGIPERYGGVTEIGTPMSPDMEILKSVSPELVISPVSLQASLEASYQDAGLNYMFMNLSSVSGMYGDISSLGETLGKEEEAAALVEEYESYMASYEAPESGDGPSVLILMCFPGSYYFTIMTDESYVGDLASLAGWGNAYAGESSDGTGVLAVNPEDVITRNDDIDKVLIFAHYNEESAFASFQEGIEKSSTISTIWGALDACQNGEVYYLSEDDYFGMSANLHWTVALDYLAGIA